MAHKLTIRQVVALGLLGLVLATIAVVALAALPADSTEREEVGTSALPVETLAIEPVDSYSKRRTYTGVLKAARTSELGFDRTARLLSVEVDEGDRVTAGQVIARLDVENLSAKHRELEAQREAARSLLRELEAGPRLQTIDAARAEVRDLQAQKRLAELNLERREQLLASQATSQEDYDRAALGLQSTVAKLDAAQRRLDELESGTRIERIESQRAVVDQIEAARLDVQVDIEDSSLRAPFAGVISKRFLDEGAIVAPGAPLFRLVEVDQLEAWIGLPAQLSETFSEGDAVRLHVESEEREAILLAVLPELDPATRTRTAIFRLSSPEGVFPQQVVRIEIEDVAQGSGFWLPTSALARGSRGLWSVLVAEDRAGGDFIAARRDIEILHTDGARSLARGTLEDGDRVIVGATHRVVAGQLIAPR